MYIEYAYNKELFLYRLNNKKLTGKYLIFKSAFGFWSKEKINYEIKDNNLILINAVKKIECTYKDGILDGNYIQYEIDVYDFNNFKKTNNDNYEKFEIVIENWKDNNNNNYNIIEESKYNKEIWKYKEFILLECNYKNGKFHGRYLKNYKYSETKYIECYYDNGILHGSYKEYDMRGNIRINTFYNNGKLNGMYELTFTNCNYNNINNLSYKFSKINYKNGKLDGPYINYYFNGNKYIECNYENGFLHGIYYKFDMNGKILEKIYYKNGL
jgi:antitoxin component YwqK of YwqJK toxin-antitoxin module